ncbi:MAG: PC4/YdbC family ssDNA-binding protein [Firmicutes bacterium]|nr:PC4/YdbC family ssDNA-binding protein [Bacillota bacterium]
MAGIKYDIVEKVGVLSENSSGWTKELNFISWNGRNPKFDIRDWDPEHDKMGKGLTLTKDELLKLRELLNSMDF